MLLQSCALLKYVKQSMKGKDSACFVKAFITLARRAYLESNIFSRDKKVTYFIRDK